MGSWNLLYEPRNQGGSEKIFRRRRPPAGCRPRPTERIAVDRRNQAERRAQAELRRQPSGNAHFKTPHGLPSSAANGIAAVYPFEPLKRGIVAGHNEALSPHQTGVAAVGLV
eukprot:6208426-Pleurochrysis_carterae.AAC.2